MIEGKKKNISVTADYKLFNSTVGIKISDQSLNHPTSPWSSKSFNTGTYTLAWGFFLEKSQARPRSEIRT